MTEPLRERFRVERVAILTIIATVGAHFRTIEEVARFRQDKIDANYFPEIFISSFLFCNFAVWMVFVAALAIVDWNARVLWEKVDESACKIPAFDWHRVIGELGYLFRIALISALMFGLWCALRLFIERGSAK
jgi:hypothetical protein